VKITKAQLKHIIQEELGKIAEVDMEDAHRDYFGELGSDEASDKRAEMIEVYNMVLAMMKKLGTDEETEDRVDKALLDLLGIAGIYL